jgi:hypothetical protein
MRTVERGRSVRVSEERFDVHARAMGLEPDRYRALSMIAFVGWTDGVPWRWLPAHAQRRLFPVFGRWQLRREIERELRERAVRHAEG